MWLQSIIQKYYVDPIAQGYGFNIVNTITYGILLVIFVYGTFEALKRLKIRTDERFALAITPFVVFGSMFRVLEDANIVHGFFFVTPGIWLLFFVIIFSCLLVSVLFERKKSIPYWKLMFVVGTILISVPLGMLQTNNLKGGVLVALWFLPWTALLKIIKWAVENKIITGIHMFDATATFVSIHYFNYMELHVLPRNLIAMTGSAFSFVLLKFLVVVSVLLILDRYSDDKELSNFIKIIIGVLGLVPATRDFVRLVWFV